MREHLLTEWCHSLGCRSSKCDPPAMDKQQGNVGSHIHGGRGMWVGVGVGERERERERERRAEEEAC